MEVNDIKNKMLGKGGFTRKKIVTELFGDQLEIVLQEPTISSWYKYAKTVGKEDATQDEQIKAEAKFLSECVFTSDGEQIFKSEDLPNLIASYNNSFSILAGQIITLLELDKLNTQAAKKK